ADGGAAILAGYPWFAEWGRDTMISLPGLLIAPGKLDQARAVIEGFLRYLDHGLIPNRLPEIRDSALYNTADATLWMFQAMRTWLDAGGDPGFLEKVFYPAAKEILEWHRRGSLYGIGIDPKDHLLSAAAEGVQLTWMDAKVGDRVI